ncbi:MAG TPA: DUF4186 domain-containing protein [Pyrinomonadaceae bacterium]|nr:DUF4186 domain-containing protein [Pyrinomonadaceae bacterium]
MTRRNLDELFAALAASEFRRRFQLRGRELEYLRRKGLQTVLEHAADFSEKRLAPAAPANDGRQTPFRGHPVFVAQHATATCCRGCLEKWHAIPKGRELDVAEKRYILQVIEAWLAREDERMPDADRGVTENLPGRD